MAASLAITMPRRRGVVARLAQVSRASITLERQIGPETGWNEQSCPLPQQFSGRG